MCLMLLGKQLKSTRPFPSSRGNFEDGAHIWWLPNDCQCCFWALVGVARCLRGHMWPSVRWLGRSEPWGGRWHPRWWQLLDLHLCHSHCCHLACASWLCASPLGLSGTGSNRAFQLLRNYHSLHSSLAASDGSLCSGTFEGFDRTCCVPEPHGISAGVRAASILRRRKRRRQGLGCSGILRCQRFLSS